MESNTTRNKILTGIYIPILILSICSSIVAFAAPLHECLGGLKFYATKLSFQGNDCSYDSSYCVYGSLKDYCLNGGRGLIGLGVFNLLTSLFAIILAVLRLIGKPRSGGSERGLAITTFILLILMMGSWGATCYRETPDYDRKLTGSGLFIACVIFMIGGLAIVYTTTRTVVSGGYAPLQGQYVPPQGQYVPPQGQYAPPQGQYAYQGQYAPPQGQYAPPQGPPQQYVPPQQYAPQRYGPQGQQGQQYAPQGQQYAPQAQQEGQQHVPQASAPFAYNPNNTTAS